MTEDPKPTVGTYIIAAIGTLLIAALIWAAPPQWW